MATLPYSKTTIRDLSSYTSIGDGVNSINTATIINAKTGPIGERVTLRTFDDLIAYFCTGSKIVQTDDVTIQSVGALLNSSPVDVIRVGTANIKIGRTDKGDIIYTDKEYNLIDLLTRVKFSDASVREDSLAIFYNDKVYYVGDQPAITGATCIKVGETVSIEELIKGVIREVNSESLVSYNDNSFILNSDADTIVETPYTEVTNNFVAATQLLTINNDSQVSRVTPGANILIGANTFVFNGDGSLAPSVDDLENPIRLPWYTNTTTKEWLLASIVSKMESSLVAAAHITYDISNMQVYSDNLAKRVIGTTFTYNKSDVYNNFYCVIDGIAYLYNTKESALEGISYDSVVSVTGESTDIIQIFTELEIAAVAQLFNLNSDAYAYFNDITIGIATAEDLFTLSDSEGLYNIVLTKVEYLPEDYSVFIDGTVYYCGLQQPEFPELEVKGYTKLSDESLTFNVFLNKLFYQLESDRVIGRISDTSIFLTGESMVVGSSNLKVTISTIDQSKVIEGAKFAVIAKFPSSQKLFNFSFIKDEEVEDYKVINLTFTYNQSTSTIKLSFDPEAVDGYGTVLYYTKYNEGDNENLFVHFIELNTDVETPMPTEEVSIPAFGNELIMSEPEAIDYASAIKKFYDYEDKMYSFIWDAGYCSPILAKAMITLGQQINAQVVPSFPNYKNVDDYLSYDKSIGANTFQVVKVVPSHKDTYCGQFLTTVPGSLSYIVARINSFNNITSEFQPLFGANRGAVSAPNLTWLPSKEEQQKLADANINCIVNNINGTYINFNLTSQKATSYLSEEQNVYMSNVIAHTCQETNSKWIAELNNSELWDDVVNVLTQKLTDRLVSGKKPTIAGFRVICNEKLNTQEVQEARQLRYKVEVMYYTSTAYVLAYEDVVRLNSF